MIKTAVENISFNFISKLLEYLKNVLLLHHFSNRKRKNSSVAQSVRASDC